MTTEQNIPDNGFLLLQARDYIRSLSSSSDPLLYHYTDAAGLLGIMSSRSLWMSDVRCMNDSTELKFALEVVSQCLLPTMLAPMTPKNVQDQQFIEWLVWALEVMDRATTFVTCFSSNGNLLSQWRGYCPAGGYSIGFDTDALRGAAESAGCFVLKCE